MIKTHTITASDAERYDGITCWCSRWEEGGGWGQVGKAASDGRREESFHGAAPARGQEVALCERVARLPLSSRFHRRARRASASTSPPAVCVSPCVSLRVFFTTDHAVGPASRHSREPATLLPAPAVKRIFPRPFRERVLLRQPPSPSTSPLILSICFVSLCGASRSRRTASGFLPSLLLASPG